MVFYGTNTKSLGVFHAERLKCQNCGEDNKIMMQVYTRYAHIYWIPAFPIGKVAVSSCLHCKHSLDNKQFKADPQYQYAYERIKNKTATPVWSFSGLALIGILICWGIFSSLQSDQEREQFLAQPMAGDVYEVKDESGYFSTMRIESVEGETVYMLLNQYSVNKASAWREIDVHENYETESVEFSKDELETLYQEGKIIDINRQ